MTVPKNAKMKTFFHYTLVVLTFLLIAFYVLALSAVIVSPHHFWTIPLLGMGFPILFVLLVITFSIWCFHERARLKMLGVIGLLLLVSFPMWRRVFVIPTSNEAHIGSRTIKIMTYNVRLMSEVEDINNILELIKENDADIVCLQEFGFYTQRRRYNQKELLKAVDVLYPYRHLWYKNQFRSMSYGLLTLSRYPIINKQKIQYLSKNNVSIYSDLVIQNDTIRLINNHLESNHLTKVALKSVLKEDVEKVEAKQVFKASGKLAHHLNEAAVIRAQQARVVAQEIKESPYPVVVAGDFNDVPISFCYQKILGPLQDLYVQSGDWGYYYTFNAHFLYFPIDHIFLPKDFQAIDCKVLKVPYSDHYPMVGEFALPKPSFK